MSYLVVVIDLGNTPKAREMAAHDLAKQLAGRMKDGQAVKKAWKTQELLEFSGAKHHKGLLLDALNPTVLVLSGPEGAAGLVK